MKITIFGSGYVGLVTGACFASRGHHVTCVDNNEQKVLLLQQGVIPIYEPGLEELIERAVHAGHLQFTTDAIEGLRDSQAVFIAVGTPSDIDGNCDLTFVKAVAREIAMHYSGDGVVVTKSTVPVGTGGRIEQIFLEYFPQRGLVPPPVLSNPEFLKEGVAIKDFLFPDRVILGGADQLGLTMLETLYRTVVPPECPIFIMDRPSAELAKYAANAMLACRISFMNEMANFAQRVGADIDQVRLGIGSDKRIGPQFLYPGVGYGGSCFPKDVKALTAMMKREKAPATLVHSVEKVNQAQKSLLFDYARSFFSEGLKGLTFAMWGLSFKPNTDDVREAPALVLAESFLKKGALLRVFDPRGTKNFQKEFGIHDNIVFCHNPLDAIKGADGLLLVTEWEEFKTIPISSMKQVMVRPVIFDGRNFFRPEEMEREGFTYYSVGRRIRGHLKSPKKS